MSKLALTALAFIAIVGLALARVPLAQASSNAQGTACVETYVVVAGDTLGSVAEKYLGAIEGYTQIFTATNEAAKTDTSFKTIADANIIDVGQKLCIPAKAAGSTPAAGTTPAASATITSTNSITPTVVAGATVTATAEVTGTTGVTPTAAAATPTPAPGSPEGTYLFSMPGGDVSAVLWELFIGPNGNASWLTNYVGRGTSNATGTWESTSIDTFNLVLIHRDGENIGERFTFQLVGDKLVATDYNHSNYGDDGITFWKANATVSGTVTYVQKIALPDDAVIEVYLLDTSTPNVAPTYISGASFRANGQQVPISFSLPYSTTASPATGTYIVQAFISSNGKLLFSNSNGVAVIGGGAATADVVLTVEQTAQ